MAQGDTTKKVAVIGVGLMGSALAEALLKRDFQVTVWNRTLTKCEHLKSAGAAVATSVAEATQVSDLIIVCLTDHATSCAVLMSDDVVRALKGKALAQVTTVTRQQSRDLAEWAKDKGIAYLDGAIMGIPQRIRDNDCIVAYSGSQPVFATYTDVFNALGGSPKFVGEQPGTAPALETARFSYTYGGYLAYFHGAAICHALDLPIQLYVDVIADGLPARGATLRNYGGRMAKRNHEEPGATIDVHTACYRHVVDLSEELAVDTALPKFMLDYFERGLASGYGQQELSALFELMVHKDA